MTIFYFPFENNWATTIFWVDARGITPRVRQEPKASVLAAYKICDLAYKNLKV